MRKVVSLVIAVVLLGACASNDLAEQGERSRAAKPKKPDHAAEHDDKKKDKGNPATAKEDTEEIIEEEIEEPGTEAAGGGGAASAPEDFGGADAPTSGVDPDLARASVAFGDPSGDAKKQGLTPNYAEVTGVSIQGLGKDVRFTMKFGGTVPNSVKKGEYFVFAFGITGRKEGEGFAIGATCNEEGWKPYAGTKGESRRFPGTFDASGSEIVMTLPWKFIEGPRKFEWYASDGWYQQLANQTHWSFDSVPNGKAGNFPG